MHPQYVLQMKPLKTWQELNADYSLWIIVVVEAILTGQSHLHFCCKFFLWRLKILKRQGVSFFWKSIEKYEINSLTISSKRWQGTESQLPASLNIENLVTNKKFLDASVTSWSQFRTLQRGVCCRFVSHFWNCLSPGRCGKDVVTFRLDKNVALGLAWMFVIYNLEFTADMVPGKN